MEKVRAARGLNCHSAIRPAMPLEFPEAVFLGVCTAVVITLRPFMRDVVAWVVARPMVVIVALLQTVVVPAVSGVSALLTALLADDAALLFRFLAVLGVATVVTFFGCPVVETVLIMHVKYTTKRDGGSHAEIYVDRWGYFAILCIEYVLGRLAFDLWRTSNVLAAVVCAGACVAAAVAMFGDPTEPLRYELTTSWRRWRE
jgi:hypothetical protein